MGALLLHALRGTVGDESFFRMLRTWTDRHRHGTVTTEMFVALAAEVAGRDLGDVFDAWLSGRVHPARLTQARGSQPRRGILASFRHALAAWASYSSAARLSRSISAPAVSAAAGSRVGCVCSTSSCR